MKYTEFKKAIETVLNFKINNFVWDEILIYDIVVAIAEKQTAETTAEYLIHKYQIEFLQGKATAIETETAYTDNYIIKAIIETETGFKFNNNQFWIDLTLNSFKIPTAETRKAIETETGFKFNKFVWYILLNNDIQTYINDMKYSTTETAETLISVYGKDFLQGKNSKYNTVKDFYLNNLVKLREQYK